MEENKTNINWFPGHMTKTRRKIEKDLKLVDAVVEIIDARIPVSSLNPDIAKLITNKPRVVLLNKCDIASDSANKLWVEYFTNTGIAALPVDCKSGKGINQFVPLLRKQLSEKIDRLKSKGMINPCMRVMIVGIPNVGKSTFINRICRKNKAISADRPGVTRGNQWFTIANGLEMLDTPGVLWPKFEDQTTGEHLAFTGAIKDNIMDIELLAVRLLELLKELKPPMFISRFKLENVDMDNTESNQLLEIIGKKRGMLISGGEVDCERAAIMVLDEFRAGKFGRITLEYPEN